MNHEHGMGCDVSGCSLSVYDCEKREEIERANTAEQERDAAVTILRETLAGLDHAIGEGHRSRSVSIEQLRPFADVAAKLRSAMKTIGS